MGSKNNPGKFDCYANAEPDEPMFILLGRDPVAWLLVDLWAATREELGKTAPEKRQEAADCAFRMRDWAEAQRKDTSGASAAMARVMKRRLGL